MLVELLSNNTNCFMSLFCAKENCTLDHPTLFLSIFLSVDDDYDVVNVELEQLLFMLSLPLSCVRLL